MKTSVKLNEYYYPGKGFNLKITSSHDAITAIDFSPGGKDRSKNIPHNVRALFGWLDDYSGRRTDPVYTIVFTGTGNCFYDPDAGARQIILDGSTYTDKQIRVYMELIKVAPGETISYGRLAEMSGIAGGARFVGNTMAGNRFPVIVPCHRVIRGDGSMGNYSGGTEIKRMLLDFEAGGFSLSVVRGQGR